MSTKSCYTINKLLRHPVKTAKQTDRMHQYPSISLWLFIASEAGLIACNTASGSKKAYSTTDKYANFREMNIFSQYLTIFNVWYCFVDIEAQYKERGSICLFSRIIDHVFAQLSGHDCTTWIENKKNNYSIFESSSVQAMMGYYCRIAYNLMDLGLIILTESDTLSKDSNTPVIEKIKPTMFGACVMKACGVRKYLWFNVYAENLCEDEDIDIFEKVMESIEEEKETFITPFLRCFPQESIDISAINGIIYGYEDNGKYNRVFEFKVSLGNKCYRIIRCLPEHTFEVLHLTIQEAFEFDNDHLYSFFLDGKLYSNYAVSSPFSEEPPYADEVCLGDVRLKDKQHILYLFDYGASWEFNIVVDIKTGIDAEIENPEIIKKVGDSPEQYSYNDEDFFIY